MTGDLKIPPELWSLVYVPLTLGTDPTYSALATGHCEFRGTHANALRQVGKDSLQ